MEKEVEEGEGVGTQTSRCCEGNVGIMEVVGGKQA